MSRHLLIATILLLLVAFSSVARAEHQPTCIMWPGWWVWSGEEVYQNKGGHFSKYPLTHLFDGNVKTCWVYAGRPHPTPDSDPAAKWIQIIPDWAVTVDAVGIVNGYAKSEKLYRHNDRAGQIVISINNDPYHGYPKGVATAVQHATLEDRMELQKIPVPRQKVYTIRIDFETTQPGEVHDFCISELALYCDGKQIDMHMPAVVQYTPGDKCGCGTEYTLIDRNGHKIFTGSGGDRGDFATCDETGRYAAGIAYGHGQDFQLAVVDMITGRVVHRQRGKGKVADITWAGLDMTLSYVPKGRRPNRYTAPKPTDGRSVGQPGRPNFQDWREEWAEGQCVVAQGKHELLWPGNLPRELPDQWAKTHNVAGLTSGQIEQQFGRPAATATNPASGAILYLYADFSLRIRKGRCDGWAPRSAGFEKWFVEGED